MGMFDYFEPEPPIDCLDPSCTGVLEGWQGKHDEGMALLLWRQGRLAPSEQRVDDEARVDDARFEAFRLARADDIPIYGGACSICDRGVFGKTTQRIVAKVREHLWIETDFWPPAVHGERIEDGWIQCRECSEACEVAEGKRLYRCPSCSRVVRIEEADGSTVSGSTDQRRGK